LSKPLTPTAQGKQTIRRMACGGFKAEKMGLFLAAPDGNQT
jgi:hypothetical protein